MSIVMMSKPSDFDVECTTYTMSLPVSKELLRDNESYRMIARVYRRYAEAWRDRLTWEIVTLPEWLEFNRRLRAWFDR